MYNNKKIIIYFHICCYKNWLKIVIYLLNNLKKSGLYDIVDEIRCGIIDKHNLFHLMPSLPKIKILFISKDEEGMREALTINRLLEDSKTDDFYVCYFHTKGITRTDQEFYFILSWINYMIYFNFYKHLLCIHLLDTYDAVGVNLTEKQNKYTLHYSGNFWWSKSNYISLKKPCNISQILIEPITPELWIGNSPGILVGLWDFSRYCPYSTYYPPQLYIDKPIKLYYKKGVL